MFFVADGVTRADVLQAYSGADISGQNLADVFALVGVHLQQTANALGPATARTEHGVTGLELPGINANESQLANERIGHDLESQRGEWFFVIGLARNLLSGVRVSASNLAGIDR